MRDAEADMSNLRAYEIHSTLQTFQRKVSIAFDEISGALRLGKSLVSTSWGKDSVALCDLVRRIDPTVPLVHLRSPYELPGNESIIEFFENQGAHIVNVETSKSLEEYIDWLQKNGLGIERRRNAKAGRNRKASELTAWSLSNEYRIQFLGMRSEESKGRKMSFRIRGMTYALKNGLIMSNPIAWWSTRDVWAYIVSRGIPWHRLYDCETHGMTRDRLRNCGWLTVARDKDDWRIPWLREHFPEQYRKLLNNFPQIGRIG